LTGAAPLLVQGATAYPLSVASARVRVGQHIPFLSAHGVELVHRPALSEREYALLISPASRLRKAALLARCAARTAGAPRREGLLLLHRLLLLTPLPGVDPRTLNRNVEVVPSCVDPRLQRRSVHGVREVTSIGWIGSHTTIEYLAPVISAVRRLHESGTPVKLTVIGGDSGVREPWIEHRDWSAQRQSSDLAEMDIGVMPLPDTEWTRGKAGYKLLQYFSAAVPAVGSPVGINAELLSDGRGIAVSSDADWERALLELLSDPAGRAQRGERARSFVEREYSYDRWSPELAMMLRTLA
jgi:glycosyltransferase involved in cell wall biosynthesis